jgi:hypothetical protein
MERVILEGGFGNRAWAVAVKADSDRRGAECDIEVSVCKCGDEHLVSAWRGTASRRKDAGRVYCACLRLTARRDIWLHAGQRAELEAAVRRVLDSKLALG